MSKAADVGGTVNAGFITHGNFNNMKVEFYCPENKLKIAKRIKVAEYFSQPHNFVIVLAEKRFRATQRISEALIERPGKKSTEDSITQFI